MILSGYIIYETQNALLPGFLFTPVLAPDCRGETMIKLKTFSYNDRSLAGLLRDILVQEGIESVLRNEQLATAAGEIPFVECFPELWILDDEVLPRARMLLDAWLSDPPAEPAWRCPHCHELCEGHFGACWSCGFLRE
jgi:hypothetical protein